MKKSCIEHIVNNVIPHITSKDIHSHFLKTDGALSRWKRSLAWIGFKINLGNFKLKGWSSAMPFYLFKCQKCRNLVVNHPRGYEGHPAGHENILDCHFCTAFRPKLIG